MKFEMKLFCHIWLTTLSFPRVLTPLGIDGLPESVETADNAASGSQLLSQAGSAGVLGRPINYWTIVARKWFRVCGWEHLCEVMGVIALIAVQILLRSGLIFVGLRVERDGLRVDAEPASSRWRALFVDGHRFLAA